jgi:hypothetical protein
LINNKEKVANNYFIREERYLHSAEVRGFTSTHYTLGSRTTVIHVFPHILIRSVF